MHVVSNMDVSQFIYDDWWSVVPRIVCSYCINSFWFPCPFFSLLSFHCITTVCWYFHILSQLGHGFTKATYTYQSFVSIVFIWLFVWAYETWKLFRIFSESHTEFPGGMTWIGAVYQGLGLTWASGAFVPLFDCSVFSVLRSENPPVEIIMSSNWA